MKEENKYKCDVCWKELSVEDALTFEGIHEHILCIKCAIELEKKLVEIRNVVNPLP